MLESRLPAIGAAGGFGQFLLQFGHTPDQFGQLLNGQNLALGLPVRLSGVTEPFLPVRDVVHHAGLRGDGRLVADLQMTGETDLPGERDEIAQFGAAGDARLRHNQALRTYHLLPSVRGDLLKKLGRFDEARAEFEHAASLTRNARERDLLLERAAQLSGNPVNKSP